MMMQMMMTRRALRRGYERGGEEEEAQVCYPGCDHVAANPTLRNLQEHSCLS